MSIKDVNMASEGVACEDGDNVSTVTMKNTFSIPRGLKLYIVKARRAGGSVILTCPHAEIGDYYHVSVDACGVITYTPVALAVREAESMSNDSDGSCDAVQEDDE